MIAWGRLCFMAASVTVSVTAGVVGHDWLKDNKDALASILSFFSVLAGFLVAVIALAADDRHLRGANWRAKHYHAKAIRRRLLRHGQLFTVYLTACFLAFADSLKMQLTDTPQAWLDGATLGMTVLAFSLSFSLPYNLTTEYLRRLNQAVQDAKVTASSPSPVASVDPTKSP